MEYGCYVTMKLGVVNTKGGVGKTTTAVYLAAAALDRGLTVELVDLDRQGSATAWLDRAGPRVGFTASIGNASTVRRVRTAAVVLFDTSPGDAQDIDAVLGVCDVLVIPTTPGTLNTERTLATLGYIHGRVPAGVVLVQTTDRTRATHDSRAALLDAGPVFDTEIPHREEIRRAAGTWPSALHGYDNLLIELDHITTMSMEASYAR